MTKVSAGPRFRALTDDECRAFLVAHTVGRVAFSVKGGVDIQPVNYAYDDGWIYGRTQIGSKLSSLAHRPACAFEVDDVRGTFSWDSVVARGNFELLDPVSGSVTRYDRAMELIRTMVPGAMSRVDPAPQRMILFGISITSLSGRTAADAAVG